jgi:translation initiation factor 1 (eIF-1/SUI1)
MSAHGPESHIVATTPFDPFAPPIIQVKVHKIRFTLIEGLDSNPYIDVKAVLKHLKKSLGCGGMLMNDPEAASGGGGGESIVLCGDQRAQVERFLVDEEQGLGISRRFVEVVVEAAEKTTTAAALSTPRIRKQKKIKSAMDLQDLMRLGNV